MALHKFTICLADELTQNLRSFVVLLHDYPLKVEESDLFSVVKKWRSF